MSEQSADLLSKEQLKFFSKRFDTKALAYFLGHYTLIALGAWLAWVTFPHVFFVPVLFLHAFVIGFLFSPLHECSHGTAFRSRWLNETALWITAVIYIVPPYFFRYFHLGHHRYTQIPGKDPSLVLPEPATFRQYLWYCLGLWFWWRNLRWIVKHAMGRVDPVNNIYVPKSKLHLMVLEARIMVGIYLVIGGIAVIGSYGWILFLCWLLPRFLGEPIQRIMRVAEHVGCEESSNPLKNTRTTLSNKFFHLLAWQMPYHAEHHLFPSVPFYQLSAVHRLLSNQVMLEPAGYIIGQRKIIRWLKTKTLKTDKHPLETPMF